VIEQLLGSRQTLFGGSLKQADVFTLLGHPFIVC
jgi:hypothetical protein